MQRQVKRKGNFYGWTQMWPWLTARISFNKKPHQSRSFPCDKRVALATWGIYEFKEC